MAEDDCVQGQSWAKIVVGQGSPTPGAACAPVEQVKGLRGGPGQELESQASRGYASSSSSSTRSSSRSSSRSCRL